MHIGYDFGRWAARNHEEPATGRQSSVGMLGQGMAPSVLLFVNVSLMNCDFHLVKVGDNLTTRTQGGERERGCCLGVPRILFITPSETRRRR